MAREASNAAGHSLDTVTCCFFTPGERPAMMPARAALHDLRAVGMVDFPGEIIFA
jgi:hypothetical protein